jgi:hypothetical protein
VEGDVAWAGAGVVIRKGMWIGQLTGFGVDEEHVDVIGAEIADKKEAVVRREGGGVGVRDILPSGIGAERAELLAVFEVDAVDRLAEGTVGLDPIGGNRAAEVVGDEGGVAGSVDRDIRWPCSAGGDLAGLFQGPGLQVDKKGGSRGGRVVDGVDGVEGTPRLSNGSDAKEGRPGGSGREHGRTQLAFGRIKVRLIDTLADPFAGIGADVDVQRRGREYRLLLPELESGLGVCRGREGGKDDEESTTGEHGSIPWETMLVRLEGESPSHLLAEGLG